MPISMFESILSNLSQITVSLSIKIKLSGKYLFIDVFINLERSLLLNFSGTSTTTIFTLYFSRIVLLSLNVDFVSLSTKIYTFASGITFLNVITLIAVCS